MTVAHPDTLGLAYLATVYTRHKAGIAGAFIEACTLAAKLIKCGVKCYSPIVNTHCISMHGGIDPFDYGIWLPFDMVMMNAADVLIVAHMPGWDTSYGIGEEIKFFEAAGKPIFDLDSATLMMVRRKTSGIPNLEELRSILTRDKAPLALTVKSALARIEYLDFLIAIDPGCTGIRAMEQERRNLVSFVARNEVLIVRQNKIS